ncbi:AMP-binding protein [Nocardia stercoris]|uniref:AMP-dependent synthetase n=1 Tax=Nocardia stercoris TaxID=2483361 RepID=A0A3M2KXR6_9NOCA|nr:AMP-binding protein [Nocardia stercoris]RMI29436.1 AMP-dependent synthetase [Nocardia stercoris]
MTPRPAAWLAAPRADAGMHLLADNGEWIRTSYPDLAAAALRAAAGLAGLGVGRDDVVCLVMPTEIRSVTAIYAVWAAGATIAPLAPPLFDAPDAYVELLRGILVQARPKVVLTIAAYESLVTTAVERAGIETVISTPDALEQAPAGPLPADPEQSAVALLQFTSGSTGTPRGVRVTWDNLTANFGALDEFARIGFHGGFASWLPLHHDMGLIGALLFPIGRQLDLWLMRPDQFVRDPARWLECFTPGKARHAACPTFGLAYVVRRVKPARLATLDLSAMRAVVVGAEHVDPEVLHRFDEFVRSAGVTENVVYPAYGLAENTVAVTTRSYGQEQRLVRLDPQAVRFGAPAPILATAELDDVDGAGNWLAGHGMPSPDTGIGVEIRGEDATALPDGHIGEIVVSGSSVAAGYHGGDSDCDTFRDGRLWTGDAGFVHGGDLYVLGRMGTSLKVNGRSVYAEDLDTRIAAETGIARRKLATVAVTEAGRPGVVVFAATAPGTWAQDTYLLLRKEFGTTVDVTVVAGPPAMILRTSSGKPRRRMMWQQWQAGELPGRRVEPIEAHA